MSAGPVTLHLNHPVPIPAGHRVETVEYADTRPEKKRGRHGFDAAEPFRHPVVTDLDTGIRWMNHVHASPHGNGGNSFKANEYPLAPRTGGLEIARTWRGGVTACTLVFVEGLSTQHTALVIAPA
ncbi:hypothetical protein [Streptomyces sp. NPDC088923]|uniref:hypothetical protein n=1 Tax=Streptomyces sp. NPDC088923 TaxID=3365913 RepID=UPI00382C1A67